MKAANHRVSITDLVAHAVRTTYGHQAAPNLRVLPHTEPAGPEPGRLDQPTTPEEKLMQLTIPHVELKQALAGLTRVVPKRATLPVLQMVRFAHEGGRITVAGTDLDQNLTYRFASATAQGEGAFLVGLADLQLLAKGADGDVGLKAVSATDIEISHTLGGQPVSRRIATEDPKEWPLPAPKIDAGPVDPAFLANFRRVSTATSSDESRRVLMGVYLDIGKQGDYLVGCDGRRLCAVNTIKLPFKDSCVVPASKFMTWPKLETGELLIGHSRPGDAGWLGWSRPSSTTTCAPSKARTPPGGRWCPVRPARTASALSEEDAAPC